MLDDPPLLLFDLDGTISNPLLGIGRSINYALISGGYPPLDLDEIVRYIGLPLDEIFGDRDEKQKLIAKYRERYGTVGYTENALYPGIVEALIELHAAKVTMAICTSKRQDFAEQILEMFAIARYFQFVSGGDIGISKIQQIESLKSQGLVNESTIMVGDRSVDLIAAHHNGLRSAGVLWGYGDRDELINESPQYLLNSPSEIIQLARRDR